MHSRPLARSAAHSQLPLLRGLKHGTVNNYQLTLLTLGYIIIIIIIIALIER